MNDNFFQNELKRFFSDCEQFTNAKYIGRAVYVDLGDNLKCKAEFVIRDVHERYEALRMRVFNNECQVDSLQLNFSDYFALQKMGPNIQAPYIRRYSNYKWYAQPTENDIDNLREAACDFISLYDQNLEQDEMEMC